MENIRGDVTTLMGGSEGRFGMLSFRDERDILSHPFIDYLLISSLFPQPLTWTSPRSPRAPSALASSLRTR